MKRAISLFFAIVLVLAGCTAKPATDPLPEEDIIPMVYYTDVLEVTPEEVAAIEALRGSVDGFTLGCGLGSECYPLPDGSLAGFSVALCELLSTLFDIPFTPATYEWDALMAGLNEKTIHFTGELTKTPERQKEYHMSLPIAERSLRIFTRADDSRLITETHIDELRIGFLRGVVTEEYVRNAYDSPFETVWADNGEALGELLLSGAIDAFVLESCNAVYFENNKNIQHKTFFPLVYTSVSLSTADPALAPIISVLDKYIGSGGINRLYEIYRASEYEYGKYSLYMSMTDQEKEYLNNLQSQNAAVPIAVEADNYPHSFYNQTEKAFQGIALDVLNEITQLTGIRFEHANNIDMSWSGIYDQLRSGQMAMVTQLVRTDAREGEFLWPDTPYASSYYALISKADYPNLAAYQVAHTRVGYADKTAYGDVYHEWFPDSRNTIVYDSTTDCLDALDRNEIDLVMASGDELLSRLNYQEKAGYKINLQFNSPALDSYFGFHKDQALLCSIVDKALALVDTDTITRDWSGRVYDYSTKLANQRVEYMTLITAILAVALIVLCSILFQNKRLSQARWYAEESSRMKSIFLANMSHEIRTPMNSIIGFTDLALESVISQQTREYLDKIKISSGVLLQIINDILDITKMEFGSVALEQIPFEMHTVFKTCQTIIAPKAAEKGIVLYCYAEPSIGRRLLGDPTRLRQALLNLLSNAVKFTNTGVVKLLSAVEDTTSDRVTIHFEVKDSGIGMTPEQLKTIFHPFTQADVSTTRKYGGTGLGLAIADNIITMMGGKLEVESAPGLGSKFSFTLTFKTVADADDKPALTHDSDMRKPYFDGDILVCEDNTLNQQVISDHLARVGLRVTLAKNGQECLDIVHPRMEASPFDLIFMDIHMPVMDGLEASKKLMEMGNTTPIVALTANVMPEDRETYSMHGMDYYMSKPFTPQELWLCLLHYLTPIGSMKNTHDASADDKIKMKALTAFTTEHRSAVSDITAALDAGDITLAHRLAHSLKGMARLVGAPKLAEASREVEAALEDGKANATPAQLECLDREMRAALDELTPVVHAHAAHSITHHDTLDKESALQLLRQIEYLLQSDDADCLDLTDKLQAIPGTQNLIKHIEQYDFSLALEELNSILPDVKRAAE